MRETFGVIALLSVGAMSGTLFGLQWLLGRFPRLLFAQALQEIVRVAKKEFRPVGFAAVLSSVIFTVIVRDDAAAWVLSAICALSMVAVIVITVRWNVPLNIQIEKWAPDSPPEGWEDVLRRWVRFNVIRTAVGVVGFAALATAVSLS